MLSREAALDELSSKGRAWDLVVVGGGATGLGTAVDAASRGRRTLLLEQHDFGKGTSSRSTKLIHGGVRYLKRGDMRLVFEALAERGLLYRNAPHLVRDLRFVIPVYRWWEAPFYGLGLKLYDRMAGRLGLGPSEVLCREETLRRVPTLEPSGLLRGVSYHDGQFDDARLAVSLVQTLADLGGTAANYVKVTGLAKHDGRVQGVLARDEESGNEYEIASRAVVNATGVFCDDLRRMDEPGAASLIDPSQGAHVVLSREFLPGDCALLVPRTEDGRVLFALPWHGRTLLGTTDTPVAEVSLEPAPLDAEIDFLLAHAAKYLTRDPGRSDVLSMFAGLRPLVRAGASRDTAALSREHTITVSSSGLVTVTGGKWTTYRRMASQVVDRAEGVAGLDRRPCRTADLRIHGWTDAEIEVEDDDDLRVYGADAAALRALAASDPLLATPLVERVPVTAAQVVWAARHEMARTVEDVLARRTRALVLDARASTRAAPAVAAILARELGRDEAWAARSAASYADLARRHVPD